MKKLKCAGKTLTFDRTLVMGILNVTPDSFFEGSRYQSLDRVLKVAEQMVADGVDILDVGGESTRPGASGAVTCEQELERVVPVVEALNKNFDQVISLDTSSALVIAEGAGAGAGMINDVRALKRKGALEAAAATDLPVVLMHSLVDQPEPGFEPHYDDVAGEVNDYLLERVHACEAAGIDRERLVLDPGFGGGMFGKKPTYDLQLLKHLDRIVAQGFPVLAGMSRKSFIAAVLDKPAEERLNASLAVAVMAAQAGAQIIRVHDVAETVDAVRMVDAVRRA
ncbi:dihydropteroate synthase [Endozoicomonas numazuensis]|uniref:dihydropteroate synthase n=1 Tax=Endozoicomonas numazuensis TaxID=1137799 RepID=A0A081NES0_9GAMM|nr:dihydropteroate synthase [Endozoicomonas numazuensis]KEQ16943.1 dihydropteroate synthase [Endozoicomonas numazuensis]